VTFIIGYKDEQAAYLVADSAVTGNLGVTKPWSHSSFGEREIKNNSESVQEAAIKIINLGRAAVAISGDMRSAAGMLAAIRNELRHASKARQAIAKVVTRTGKVDPRHAYVLLCATPDPDGPKLFGMTSDGEITDVEIGCSVTAGSLGIEPAAENLCSIVLGAAGDSLLSPSSKLTAMIAAMQNYSMHNYLLPSGVGGAFTGMLIDRKVTRWQDNILSLFHDGASILDDYVFARIYENVLVITSHELRADIILACQVNTTSSDAWLKKWHEDFRTDLKRGRVDYLVIQSTKYRRVAIHSRPKTSPSVEASRRPWSVDIPANMASVLSEVSNSDTPQIAWFH
jgi:hypothetical protein